MNLIVFLLILLLAVVIVYYIIEQLPIPAQIKWVVQLIFAVIFLIVLLGRILPLAGVSLDLSALPIQGVLA